MVRLFVACGFALCFMLLSVTTTLADNHQLNPYCYSCGNGQLDESIASSFRQRINDAHNAGVQKVVSDYVAIKDVLVAGAGAASGGVAANRAAQELVDQAGSRVAKSAAQRAAKKAVIKGALHGTGWGTAINIIGDLATYATGFAEAW